jgi:hypothetical protein
MSNFEVEAALIAALYFDIQNSLIIIRYSFKVIQVLCEPPQN